jgi:hypothetical protein
MTRPTHPRAALATMQLGRPVVDYITEKRAAGLSFRRIASALRDETGGQTDVSDVTVRSWWAAHLAESEQSA